METRSDAVKIVKGIKEQIHTVTGFEVLNVVSLERVDDGWAGRVEVTELRRVPDTQNLVGVYDVTLDNAGNLVSWNRQSLRVKGQPIGLDDLAQ